MATKARDRWKTKGTAGKCIKRRNLNREGGGGRMKKASLKNFLRKNENGGKPTQNESPESGASGQAPNRPRRIKNQAGRFAGLLGGELSGSGGEKTPSEAEKSRKGQLPGAKKPGPSK